MCKAPRGDARRGEARRCKARRGKARADNGRGAIREGRPFLLELKLIKVITPTGDRPEAWKLCQHYMARQNYAGPVEWHVVDDGRVPLEVEFERDGYALHLHRLAPMAGNSQARNLLHLLSFCQATDRLACFEDDDWYSPDWLSHVAAELEHAELVGEIRARYYNVATRRWKEMGNTGHASLCATAMRGSAIEAFRLACRRAPRFIDLDLWRRHRSRHLFGGHRVIGIKGLPGRGGIGIGHKQHFGTPDPDGRILRQWIGKDAEMYL